MPAFLPLLFPFLGNLLAIYLVVGQKHHALRTMLKVNVITSLLFGLSIALKVLCCSAEPGMWLMPLFLAPVEYWLKFGAYIALLAIGLFAWQKNQPKN